jgi:PAS domain S-box-containing protein
MIVDKISGLLRPRDREAGDSATAEPAAALDEAAREGAAPLGADQAMSDADQSASAADQLNADSDQRSSDRDQAASDRDHAAAIRSNTATEDAYDVSRGEREAASDERLGSQVGRATTARDRDVTGRFRAVSDAGPNGVVAVDAQGAIIYANAALARMFGYETGALIGQSIELLIPPQDGASHARHRAEFGAQSVVHEMGPMREVAGRRKDDSEFSVEISLSPIDTSDGLQVFATVVDITARKAAEARRTQAEKLESLGRLAAGIAHDFNNMLSAIQGYASVLADDLAPARRTDVDFDASMSSVRAISLAAERAANLTAQLLAFSRHQVVTPIVLDVSDVVSTIEPMIQLLLGPRGNLTMSLDGAAGHVRADPAWIDQLLVNLVVNARDAMPDGGVVRIETGRLDCTKTRLIDGVELPAGSYAFISVADTGAGIDPITREHMFEPYFTTKATGKGTGLGLATTHSIVNQAGGHILVESEPGQGASFKLLFPRIDLPAERAGRVPLPGTTGSAAVLGLAQT